MDAVNASKVKVIDNGQSALRALGLVWKEDSQSNMTIMRGFLRVCLCMCVCVEIRICKYV